MNFLNDITIKGKWWIPSEGKREEKVYGELVYKRYEGISLILEGSFFNTTNLLEAKTNIKIPFVHGMVVKGNLLLFLNCGEMRLGGVFGYILNYELSKHYLVPIISQYWIWEFRQLILVQTSFMIFFPRRYNLF